MENLIVGSAAWRSNYGISNSELSQKELNDIFNCLKNYEIKTIDTAESYGDTEKVLHEHDLSLNIHTKVSPFINQYEFETKLSELDDSSVEIVYFHDHKIFDTFSIDQIKEFVEKIISRGFKPGFSLYEVHDFMRALDHFHDKAYFQLPLHIFDLKFIKILNESIKEKVIFRSLLIRGLIFLRNTEIKNYLQKDYSYTKQKFEKAYQMKFEKASFTQLTYSLISLLNKKNIKFTIGLNSPNEIMSFIEEVKSANSKLIDWNAIIEESNTIIPIEKINI